MVFSTEVKDFIKNTLILTLIFTLVLQLSWGYVAPIFGIKTSAGSNDLTFQQANITYLGNIATAMSLSVGQRDKQIISASIDLGTSDVVSIAEVLSNPTVGQQRLIGSNMIAVSSYANLLSTDILSLLDQSGDRSTALNEHIALLKNYYTRTEDRIKTISEQMSDLSGLMSSAGANTTSAKAVMQNSFSKFDYTGVDTAIDSYIKAKDQDTRARVYMIYLDNFRKSYIALQAKNLKLLDTLTNNRDALVKRATVIIPNSGSELLRTLKLIQSESEISTNTSLQ